LINYFSYISRHLPQKALNFSSMCVCEQKVFVGFDGCRGSWFAVFLAVENDQNCELFFGQAFFKKVV